MRPKNQNSLSLILLVFILFTTNIELVKAQEINVAQQKQVKVSSENEQHLASMAVDGVKKANNYWQTAKDSKTPQFMEIDLHKYNKISSIVIYTLPGQVNSLSEQLNVQYWDDANWTNIITKPILDKAKNTITYAIKPSLITFMVKIETLSATSLSISEVEVFGSLIEGQPLPETPLTAINSKPQDAQLSITKNITSKSFKYVGYNQGYYLPGSNVSGWIEYSQTNSMRVWTTLSDYAPLKAFNTNLKVADLDEFEELKKQLRSSPEKNDLVNWDLLLKKYETNDMTGNKMNFGYVLAELKRLDVDPILQINERKFEDNWKDKWEHWERFYTLAYYAAKKGNVAMFAMQNEPNHKAAGPMDLPTWMLGLQIASDAVKCAVDDVNIKYKKDLNPKFVAPITAGYNTDWWAYVVSHIRDGYDGKKIDKDLFDIFSTHSYNQPASGYQTRVSDIRKIIKENHPEHKDMPIVFTEIGRWMNALLIDKKETYDSPSVFTEWAGIYANNLKNHTYGMWAFKFANTVSGDYTEGIKSGHHLTWQGQRIVEDAYHNLALNKSVTANSGNQNSMKCITDGDKSDYSTWISDSTDTQKTIEINLGKNQTLGSAIVYTGSSYGVYTGPDGVRNFMLQYWSNGAWKSIPETVVKDGKYVRYFFTFKNPVTTDKIRWVSSDKGKLKVREIKVFAQGDGPSQTDDYDIAGLHRTGEVVRLFAKGFKNERPLFETKANNEDAKFDYYTSCDEQSGNYYMWLVQRGGFDYHLTINLSDLGIPAGNPVIAETVNPVLYGEVSAILEVSENQNFNITLPAQSVMLITIPTRKSLEKSILNASADATVSGGKDKNLNQGNAKELQVALNAENPEKNKVSFINFSIPETKNNERVILGVNGIASSDAVFRIHVYAIPNNAWNEDKINWTNAPQLDKNEALITKVGTKAFVAGELAFDGQAKYHYLDVTDIVKNHPATNYTFALVRETRELGDDGDKNRVINISSKEGKNAPQLMIWKVNK